MRVILSLAVGILLTASVQAGCDLSSARLGNQVLKVGDAERKVLRHDPDRAVQLENRRGGATGIRYDFYLHGKTIQVYVRAGRISRICHFND